MSFTHFHKKTIFLQHNFISLIQPKQMIYRAPKEAAIAVEETESVGDAAKVILIIL